MFVMLIQSVKRCKDCYLDLPFDDFGRDSQTRDGLNNRCRGCAAKRQRGSQLKSKYGISLEQHQQMYMDQGMCCACCGDQIAYDRVVTDHDHKTNKVRGLLCPGCNIGIGHLGDNLEGVQQAVDYLTLNRG